MKSITKTFLVKPLDTAVVLTRSLHTGFPCRAKKIRGDSKVSAAVRASSLSKEDQKTEQVPEELRHPTEAIAAAASSTGPKRSELDQRKVRKTECASQLQGLMVQRNVSPEDAVQCLPFVKMLNASDNPMRRCFETPEELLQQEQDPLKLAKVLIKLKRELQAEKAKSEAITQNYLELKAELYARHCALASQNSVSESQAASGTASATSSSQGKPVTASSSCSQPDTKTN